MAVFVHPDFVRQGFGAALMTKALERAAYGADVMRLESTLNAVSFYERFGFRATSRTVVRRNDVDVHVVVMERRVA